MGGQPPFGERLLSAPEGLFPFFERSLWLNHLTYVLWQPHYGSALNITYRDWLEMDWSDADHILEDLETIRQAEIDALPRK